jgi:inactivated superfamily I helicase
MAFAAVKMAVFAPMPIASDTMAVMEKTGASASIRTACLRCRRIDVIDLLDSRTLITHQEQYG